jgi:hypothetical protein
MSEQEPKKKIIPLHTDGTPYSAEELEKLAQDTGMPKNIFIPESHKIEGVENAEDVVSEEDVELSKEILARGIEKLREKHDFPEHLTPKSLKELMALKEMLEPKKDFIPKGTIPLNAQQLGYEAQENEDSLVNYPNSVMDLSFSSYESMIRILKRRMDEKNDEEAKAVLNELIRKQEKANRGSEYEFSGGAKDFCKKKGEFRKRD